MIDWTQVLISVCGTLVFGLFYWFGYRKGLREGLQTGREECQKHWQPIIDEIALMASPPIMKSTSDPVPDPTPYKIVPLPEDPL